MSLKDLNGEFSIDVTKVTDRLKRLNIQKGSSFMSIELFNEDVSTLGINEEHGIYFGRIVISSKGLEVRILHQIQTWNGAF